MAGPRVDGLKFVLVGVTVLFVGMIVSLIAADVYYLVRELFMRSSWSELVEKRPNVVAEVMAAMKLSVLTSLATMVLVVLFSVPVGYALSRYRFVGHTIINTIVDVPIVLPPVMIGISLLALYSTSLGEALRETMDNWLGWTLASAVSIIMCQFLVSVSYSIRATKASFDQVDQGLERVAMSLGCSPAKAFWKVSLPLARNGLIAGSVMAWARAVGVFGPIMVFVGTGPRERIMPTAIWLELNNGDVEIALMISLFMLLLAGMALMVVHWLMPGKNWT